MLVLDSWAFNIDVSRFNSFFSSHNITSALLTFVPTIPVDVKVSSDIHLFTYRISSFYHYVALIINLDDEVCEVLNMYWAGVGTTFPLIQRSLQL